MDVDQQYLIYHHVSVQEFQAMLVMVDSAYEDIQVVD